MASCLQWLKASILPQLIFAYIFLASGLIVCSLMLVSLVVWPFDRHLYRKINSYLGYSLWSQFTFVGQWWAGIDITLYVKEEDKPYIGKEHVLAVMNHKYDIDWLIAWCLCERHGFLGGTKIYGKQILKYIPILGWAWWFTESIFLKRQWDHDKKVISRDLQQTSDYPDGYSVTLLLFPEGTRFTPEKHKASLEICGAKGYPPLHHVLLPRPKGFITSMHGLRGRFPTILNCTVGFSPLGPAPTLSHVLSGRPLEAHFVAERIPLDSVPIDTDEACAAWLRDLFKRKDDLYENFLQHDRFPGNVIPAPRRPHDLLMWLFWFGLLVPPLVQYLWWVLVHGSLVQQCVVGVVIMACCIVRYVLIGISEIEKGSKYGKDINKNKKCE